MAIASPTPQSTPTAATTTVQLPGGGAIHICINIYGGAPAVSAPANNNTETPDPSEIHAGEYGIRWFWLMDGLSGNTNVLGSFAVVAANAKAPFFGLSQGHDHWSFSDPTFLATRDSFRMVPAVGEPAQFSKWRKQLEGSFTTTGPALDVNKNNARLFQAFKGKYPQAVDAWLHFQPTPQGDRLTWLAVVPSK